MSVRAEIAADLCAGTSNCVEELPEVFEIGPDGLARLRKKHPTEAELRRGAEACPVQAILLFDISTGTRIYP
jgi:ferredoxin